MSWFAEAKRKREIDPTYGYGRIAKEYGLTWDIVRNRFRRENSQQNELACGGIVTGDVAINLSHDSIVPLDEKLYALIKNGKPLSTDLICDKLQINPKILSATLESLQDDGFQILEQDNEVSLCKLVIPKQNVVESKWEGEKVIRFGVVTDTHLGSHHQQLTHLNRFYDLCERERVEDMFHVGDITDGVNMRVGHQFELWLNGVDRQVNYTIDKYPRRKGMKTTFITGNHDASSIKSAGHDIGNTIERERDDLKYVGCLSAKIMITPKCSVQLSHPIDGSSYALSYKLQRSLDAMSGGNKPNILLVGHYHKAFYMLYRNVHALTAGCFQAQTPWMEAKQIAAMMGGWIITVHVGEDGQVNRFLPEFVPFYDFIPDDY